MPHETEILFNESGIQYQGVNDASGSTGAYPIQGLIVGQFKRGRLDKPMTIHRDNIKAMLGYEPQSPCYIAVQDVLNTGVPSVEVLRIGGVNISCDGAIPVAYFFTRSGLLFEAKIEINGTMYNQNYQGDILGVFERYFPDLQVDSMSGMMGIINYSPNQEYRIKLYLHPDDRYARMEEELNGSGILPDGYWYTDSFNPTIGYDLNGRYFSFCLSANPRANT